MELESAETDGRKSVKPLRVSSKAFIILLKMEVKFNGEKKIIQLENLKDFIVQLDLHKKTGIAVALNAQVIPRSLWEKTILCENDDILLITAAAGG